MSSATFCDDEEDLKELILQEGLRREVRPYWIPESEWDLKKEKSPKVAYVNGSQNWPLG